MSEHKAQESATRVYVHTLGPTGTNCERAAYEWLGKAQRDGDVILHQSLEMAMKHVKRKNHDRLLSCIVYPDLHTLVFSNLDNVQLVDCFVMPTYNMILASRSGRRPRTVSTHPAPQGLVPSDSEKIFVSSNATAAAKCAAGETDGCITTSASATAHNLAVLKDFGAVPMGFAIHAPCS